MKKQVDAAAFERYKQEHDRCLGIAVCQLRTEKGLTPDQLAKPAEVSAQWIRRLETNQLHTNYSIGRRPNCTRFGSRALRRVQACRRNAGATALAG